MKAALAPEDLSSLPYPLLVSPKLDGIRAIRHGGRLITARGKLVPNAYVSAACVAATPDGVEGELVLPLLTERHRDVASAIMSRDGEPEFRFALFDEYHGVRPFGERLDGLRRLESGRVFVIPHHHARSAKEVVEALEAFEEAGFEGLMLKDPRGRYRQGPCHRARGPQWKLKSFEDEEAEILRIEEEIDKNGVPKGTLGAVWCRFLGEETEWKCGSGFDAAEREALWSQPPIGLIATVKHQAPPGGRPAGERPRFPVWKGLRQGF